MLLSILLFLLLRTTHQSNLRTVQSTVTALETIDAVHTACDLSHQLIDGKDTVTIQNAIAQQMFELLNDNIDALSQPLSKLVHTVHRSGPSFLTARTKSATLKISHLVCNDPLITASVKTSTRFPSSNQEDKGGAIRFASDPKKTSETTKTIGKKDEMTLRSGKTYSTASTTSKTETASSSKEGNKDEGEEIKSTDENNGKDAGKDAGKSTGKKSTGKKSTGKNAGKSTGGKTNEKTGDSLTSSNAAVSTLGEDQCALPHSNGMQCKGFQSHDQKPSWCCRGECKSQHRFQAECETVCPQEAVRSKCFQS